MKKRSVLLVLLLLCSLIPVSLIPFVVGAEGDYIGSWDTSGQGTNAEGITTDGNFIWTVDWGNDEVYKYTMAGVYTTVHWDTSAHGGFPQGIATDGTNIWICDSVDDEVYKYTMVGGYVNSWDTSVQSGDPYGITTDGNFIWISDPADDEVYKYTMAGTYTGEHWETSPVHDEGYGIATDGRYIWMADINMGRVYKYTMDGIYVDDWFGGDVFGPAGIATDGLSAWVSDRADDEVYVYDVDSYTIDVGILNMEGCGDWVFEGRTQYIFYINTTSIGDDSSLFSAGMGFYDDAGDWYSFFYSNVTERVTLTNPDDGISVALRSVETGDEWLYLTFYVMFNPPVADTLDVDVYVRYVVPVSGDSGWVVEEEDYFNIYNLGGFSTLTHTGWSGRTAGGDVFEIYAADTRVAKMFLESFEQQYETVTVWKPSIVGVSPYLVDVPAGGLAWLILDDRPYSNITATSYYPNTDSRVYAYTGPAYNPTWRDGKASLHVETIDATNIIPWTAKQFLRPITAETVMTTVWWQSPANSSTSRLKWADMPTYLGAAKTAVNLQIHSLGGASIGEVECDIGGNAVKIYDVGAVNAIQWKTDTWYNVTVHIDMTTKRWTLWWDGVATNATNEVFADAVGPTSLEWFLALGSDGLGGAEISDFYIDAINCTTDFSGDFGGDVIATTLFNRLQHWHMDFDLDVEDGYVAAQYANYGFFEMGWDICLNGTWENNFLVAQVNITSADTPSDASGLGAGVQEAYKAFMGGRANWVRFNITWTQNGSLVKRDTLYGLYEGHGKLTTTAGARDAMGWHWDMWFNSMNASTVVGGRINCEWFGMASKVKGFSSIWTSAWKPMVDEVTDSTCFVELRDSTDDLHSAKEVTLVRSWVRVWRSKESTFHYEIKNIEGMDFRRTKETMSGVDTPPIIQTMAPKVFSGFMGSILGTAFMAVMSDFADGIIFGLNSMWSVGAGMIAVFFGAIGFPGLVSTIDGIMGSFFAYMNTVLAEGFLYDFIDISFTMTTGTFGFIMIWLTRFINFFFGTGGLIPTVISILDGTNTVITGLTNVWTLISIDSWIEAVPVFGFVVWLSSLDDRAKKGPDGQFALAIKDIIVIQRVLSFFINIMFKTLDMFLNIVFRMAGLIRG